MYQLSKNLNRPFFVDFLTHLSIRYTESGGKLDEEDPEETGGVQLEVGWDDIAAVEKYFSFSCQQQICIFPIFFFWHFQKKLSSEKNGHFHSWQGGFDYFSFNSREPFPAAEAELHSQVERLWNRPGKIQYGPFLPLFHFQASAKHFLSCQKSAWKDIDIFKNSDRK